MTRKLYDEDSHMQEFEAQVLSCRKEKENYLILLDQTAFFPEGGGQDGDTGYLECTRVIDTQAGKDGIWHITQAPLTPGIRVKGKIDYAQRFSRMQQHSGEHIVSGLLCSHFGYHNMGFHLGEETVTLDTDGSLTQQELEMIEWEANEAVAANLPVRISYPEPEELEKIEYRSKKEVEGPVRLVTIPGYDVCACCAPHVKQTGEIGIIKLTGMMHYKGGTRISMLCGFRALLDYRRKTENVVRISNLLSVKQQETADGAERLLKEYRAEKERSRIWRERLLAQEMKDACEEDAFCLLFTRESDRNILRHVLQKKAAETGKLCGAFMEDAKGNFQYLLVKEEGDIRNLAAEMNRDLRGKGGGKPKLVQGSVEASKEEIQEWMKREVRLG